MRTSMSVSCISYLWNNSLNALVVVVFSFQLVLNNAEQAVCKSFL